VYGDDLERIQSTLQDSNLDLDLTHVQMSFASSGTTIVSGAVAGRMRMSSYAAYCIFFTVTYSIVSHWLWAANGWLRALGGVDASGSGVVHLCGGTGALASIMLLGPRKGTL
jgi:Amt family ammonium transporter